MENNKIRTLMDVIAEQETGRRTSDFTEYTSKKKFIEGGEVNEEVTNLLAQIKNTFTYNVHKGGKYVIITTVKDKNYCYMVVNVETKIIEIADAGSIKNAKAMVRGLLEDNADNEETTETATEEIPTTDTTSTEENNEIEPEKKSRKAK